MNIGWISGRAMLQFEMQRHPDWSIRQLHRHLSKEIGCCYEWVRKWFHRLKGADPNDESVLLSRSRRRKTPYEVVGEAVEAKIIHLRDTLSKDYNRLVGSRNIHYQLHRDEALKWMKVFIPTSRTTITRILHKYHRIPRKTPYIHIPNEPSEPMQVWEIDYTDVATAHSERTDKKAHEVESFHVVDAGTSIELKTLIRDDFNAETTILALTDVFMSCGLPKVMRFDRDPRLVGSWSADKFPSAVMRFLLCLGISPDICPARRPDKKGYVERFIRSFKQECVYKVRPSTVVEAQQAANNYSTFYNLERPNQALTCRNQPPSIALGMPPYLPQLPETIDPDAWLNSYHKRSFRRRVRSGGSVTVDKHNYYVGKHHNKQMVTLILNAETKEFDIRLGEQIIKSVDIKGLYLGTMAFGDYLIFIQAEATSEQRRLKAKRRIR